jgi:hypothetical protein
MRQLIATTLGFIITAGFSVVLRAETAVQVTIPEKVKTDIIKRHPKAIEFQASHENHFKRRLLEVSFKEEGSSDEFLELFREDGHLFTSELLLDDLHEAPTEVSKALQQNFPGYTLKRAEMIANPNDTGEEYEVYLQVGSENWKVSLNEKGVIQGKEAF